MNEYTDYQILEKSKSLSFEYDYFYLWKEFYRSLQVPNFRLLNNKLKQIIDYIEWNEIKHPAVKGIDIFRRPFLVLKIHVDKKHKFMIVLFQRYCNEPYFWKICQDKPYFFTLTESNFYDIARVELIKKILSGKKIVLNNLHGVNRIFKGKTVELLDENKYSNIIKNAWVKCRTDPEYKICRKIKENHYYNLLCI